MSKIVLNNQIRINARVLHRWYTTGHGPELGTEKIKPDLPDYNTSIDIHEHKLQRPTKPPPMPKWDGLKNLSERTQGSLIPETLKEMEKDGEFKETLRKLKEHGQKKLTREERKKRQRALDSLGVPDFLAFWIDRKKLHNMQDEETVLRKNTIEIVQANIGIYCNQACNHCHVESSPKRSEMMDRSVAEKILDILAKSPSVNILDITGGAPELCTEFRRLAKGGRDLGKEVIDRCNLTSLLEPGQEDTPEFLAENKIHIVASLPCYTPKNVNLQRGSKVFERSIHALQILNNLGYGKSDPDLQLDLVYNPLGAYLPPPQGPLEEKYREEMLNVFGIEFNKLYTMTNMPIKRFTDFLYRRNELQDYMELLVRNYNINTVPELMCRNLLSVSWNGRIYDCDFNQQLEMGMMGTDDKEGESTVWDITSTDDVVNRRIAIDNHCYGCTAGMGSS
ncbi:hypothetical protein FSP39_001832 [Pinctada imbricata]|uniref:Arsenosugar biosynthesis radical SAM protein ArsS-like C-terminal domain-containing protein n=1 Tax=Pinctada imbricata TaxID=66713 RepID=A0AA88YG99_PINIB|nr:hypothetical protein FSP39_001832 [Pinctada imbricata]